MISREQVENFLFKEGRLLDEQQWDEWLECYDPSARFWMPSWDDDGELTNDPQREISLIYYPDRKGLEDRVFRIKTERSSATSPIARTSHNISNVEIIEQQGTRCSVRFNWHTLSHRHKQDFSHYGYCKYEIDFSDEKPKIMDKYIVLKNDYIHQVIDIYNV
ncbi:benzoate 1,2-dioxygenase small subunit [Limnobacter sp.]|uniref:benzoate 1,2-dioxygenase small subunit n=1 Tax=Limnobacter sp. TaxID=2003368 RepID=UPI0039C8F6CF